MDTSTGWYKILIEDTDNPSVRLECGGFPDQVTAMWFVKMVELFMLELTPDFSVETEENDQPKVLH